MNSTIVQRPAKGQSSPLFVFLASVIVRVGWLALGPSVIESEGSYYARVGENLAAGHGYVGIREAGLQILYPPLYPILIALGVRMGLSPEMAGRSVSMLAGIAFPCLAFAVAKRLYGPRAGAWAGWLAALHPLLVALSAAVLTEQTYLALTLAAAWFTLRAVDEGRWVDGIAAGICCGLAYLTRPEGLLYGIACVAIVLLARRMRAPGRAKVGVAVSVPFACIALAYIVPLSLHVGAPHFEAKLAEGVATSRRLAAGQSLPEIFFSIDQELRDTGLSNMSNVQMVQETHATLGERLQWNARSTLHNLPHLVFALLARRSFGNPFLFVLVVLGLLARRWTRERALREGPLLTLAALNLLTFGFWPYIHERFIFPLLAPWVVWAGAGLATLPYRLRRLWTRWAPGNRQRAFWVAAPAMAALLVAESTWGVRRADDLSDAWTPGVVAARSLGEGLKKQLRPHAHVADSTPTVAFYAGAVLQPLPWTDSATAIRYLALRRPDAVVLRRSMASEFPFARDWYEHGIPEGRGEPLETFALGNDEAKVFLWRAAPGDPTRPEMLRSCTSHEPAAP